jgi:predicted dehydrogenase
MAGTLRVAVVGCGRIAQAVHLGTLSRLPGVEVVALADPDPVRLGAAGRRIPTATAFRDYREALARDDVHAAVIGTPTATHAEVATAALRLGKHIYLEKPIATDLEDARGILSAWRDSGAVGMIGFNYRFNPLYQALARQVAAGRVGEVVAVRSVFSTTSHDLPLWKRARALGGGVLLDLASHHVDLIPRLLGREAAEVSATLRSRRAEDDTATLELRLDGGALVQSFFSLDSVEEDRLEVYGRRGKLSVDRYTATGVRCDDATRRVARLEPLGRGRRALTSARHLIRKLRAPGHEPSYHAALAHFVAAARSGQPASPDLDDGYRSLAIIAAAEHSAATGQIVRLGSPDMTASVPGDAVTPTGAPLR